MALESVVHSGLMEKPRMFLTLLIVINTLHCQSPAPACVMAVWTRPPEHHGQLRVFRGDFQAVDTRLAPGIPGVRADTSNSSASMSSSLLRVVGSLPKSNPHALCLAIVQSPCAIPAPTVPKKIAFIKAGFFFGAEKIERIEARTTQG
mmetsp:Transcript_5157/g.8278  ORF Transcript_5157/g.8278 Transcript_5157/m.8278 type:complete len:148 (+) Transcript_5157:955-1398(+)